MATSRYVGFPLWILPVTATTHYGYFLLWILPVTDTSRYGYFPLLLLPVVCIPLKLNQSELLIMQSVIKLSLHSVLFFSIEGDL